MKKIYVYVAGPLTGGKFLDNVKRAITTGDTLRCMGYVPFVPHANVMWELLFGSDYETWMEYDFAWLRKCDVLFRLPGDSPGADREEELARELGIPVVHSIPELSVAAYELGKADVFV